MVAVAVLAAGLRLPAGAQDMSQMCGNADALKAAPQLAQFCSGAGNAANPDAGGLKPSGGAMGNLGTGGPGGMPDMSKMMQGGGMPGMPPGATPPGSAPGAGGEGSGEGGGAQAAPKPMMGNSGGGPASSSRASSIQSISGQFKGFSDAGAMKEKMRQQGAQKAAQQAAAEEALRKKQAAAKAAADAAKAAKEKEAALKLAEEDRIRKEKEAESARLAAELAALSSAAATAAPVPSLRTPPSQNPVLYSFELTTPLLREVDLDEPYGGLRKLYDTPLAPTNLELYLKDGVSLEVPPRLMFNLVPLENDPFNFGLPKRGPAGPSGWLAKFLALLPSFLGGRRGAGSPYLGFDEYRPAAGKAEPFAIGVVPQVIYWSGPVSGAPLVDPAQAPAAAKLPPVSEILGDSGSPEDPAAAAALAWGL